MSPPLQPVRGTRDIIGADAARHAYVVETARRVTGLYGFAEWQTPIFEETRVFSRTLGETSDVVTKEMYTFDDRGGDSITLRPEATAAVCRALISNGLTQTLPQRAFYHGPMFRYERPQKGRYRQFHQIGVELLGPSTPLADAEVIAAGWQILNELGIAGTVELQINTLGDAQTRTGYRSALVEYFSRHAPSLSAESKIRLEKNPLRILDSKDEGDQRLTADAPRIQTHFSDAAREFYDQLKKHLTIFGIPFGENPNIVRGLDYYTHTAFEFVTTSLGAQGTVLAGGRYDGLVEQMGGPNVPGVGWAAGIERLAMLLTDCLVAARPVTVIHMAEDAYERALAVLNTLRCNGIAAETGYQGNVKRRLERANKSGAKFAVLVAAGDNVPFKLKNLDDGTQSDVSLDALVAVLK